MKVRTDTIVQTFKPLRITIDIDDARDMDIIRDLLQYALHGKSFALDARGQTIVRELVPAFTRL